MPKRDNRGFLVDLKDWNPDIASHIALEEGILLTKDHWEILHLIRAFHDEFDISPTMRAFVKYIKQHLGETKGNSIYLLKLFPDSPIRLAAKIAGLPKPVNCL